MSRRALPLLAPLFLLVLTHCRTPVESSVSTAPAPAASGQRLQIINVSAYDPKEKQREGRSYSQHDVSALRDNGAVALIARAGKGGNLDTKCADFLTSADRAGMLPGVYYRLQNHVDAVAQADQFINRAQALAASRDWAAPALLLVGDFDAQSRMDDILRFMDRVESRTGVVPVAYLENSGHLKNLLSQADEATKARIRRMPYWIALYSHDKGYDPNYPQYPVPGHPEGLTRQYNLWSDWTIWQYGGVEWTGGRSVPKVYNHGNHRYPLYFGDLDRPVERNVFRGSMSELQALWKKHGVPLR